MGMLSHKNLLNLRQIAISNVMEDDLEFYVEKCYRYYSKTYHTPLHIAKEKVSEPEVVKIFMEDEMEDWTPDDMVEFKAKVNETPRVVIAAPSFTEEPEEVDEEMWIAQQTALLKQQEAKEKKKQEDIMNKTHEAIDKMTAAIKNIEPIKN